ncbi:hypothetical protein Csa_011470 [Cucumis sativus]|nr:hypothetical protein Csa_011470 [Cucumis sativus]
MLVKFSFNIKPSSKLRSSTASPVKVTSRRLSINKVSSPHAFSYTRRLPKLTRPRLFVIPSSLCHRVAPFGS